MTLYKGSSYEDVEIWFVDVLSDNFIADILLQSES